MENHDFWGDDAHNPPKGEIHDGLDALFADEDLLVDGGMVSHEKGLDDLKDDDWMPKRGGGDGSDKGSHAPEDDLTEELECPPKPLGSPTEAVFGKQQTRERKTEIEYTQIALRFWSNYERYIALEAEEGASVTPMGMVIWLIAQKPKWSKPTWRRYKSSVVYYLRSILGDADALIASDYLEAVTSNGCKSTSDATSSGRLKNVTREEFMRFLACFSEVNSARHRYAGIAKTWMLLGCLTGLRPHEWGQAELLRSIPNDHELVRSGRLKAGGNYLRIKNSKHTNGRANGEFRHLSVSKLPAELLVAMDSLISILSDRVRYLTIYNNCSRFIFDANRHFFGRDNKKRFHLYTSRHRFASEAKSQLPSDHVAAAMGHGSDQTAYSTYGNARFSSGGLMVEPVDAETVTVKKAKGRKKPYESHGDLDGDNNMQVT